MAINQLKAGAVLNYVVLGVNNLVGLLYIPYMLRMLGQSEYGLYSLVASVIAYLTIMDFGFGNAIIRYTAKFRAEHKLEEQYSMFGMFLVLYSLIGVLAFGAGLGLYFNVEALFGDTMTAFELSRAKILMLILIFNLAVTFPMSIFKSIITAYEKFVFQKVLQIAQIVLNTVVTICLLTMGYRAIAMVIVQTVVNLIALFFNCFYCRYKIRIRIVFGKFRWDFLREVMIYSCWIFLNAIIDRFYWNTGQFVLGAVAGTVAVAVFSVAIQLGLMYNSFVTAISSVFLPRITAMVAAGYSDREISDLFIRVGRVQYIVTAFILTGFILFGRQFIALWAGQEYENTYFVTLLFFGAMTVQLVQNIGFDILQARNQLRFRSLLYIAVVFCGLMAQVALARRFGALGCMAAIAGGLVIGQIVMNVYFYRKQNLDIFAFWREIARMSVVPILLGVSGWFVLQRFDLSDVWKFATAIAAFSLVYMPAFWWGGMNKYERSLLTAPLSNLFLRCVPKKG